MVDVTFRVRTVVVGGALAFQMRRAAAARESDCGLQIWTLPLLAARLAGGFTTPITPEHLDLAVQDALAEGGFGELESVRHLPGMTRALSRSLRKLWDADIDLRAEAYAENIRLGELALIEERIRRHLPVAMLAPHDLRNAALGRIHYAARTVGPVTIEGLSFVAPVWRPLIDALAKEVPVEWHAPRHAETQWFAGTIIRPATSDREPTITAISCADPHHEVVEALRWARCLIVSGAARPHEIAIASAGTVSWDDHFCALAADAGLNLHFPHGIPALSTRDGQRCAALADVLLHGLNQQRMRRLISLCRGQGTSLDALPQRWLASLPHGATLARPEDWRRAISAAALKDPSLAGAQTVLPLLEVLAKGISAAKSAADHFLRSRALQLWEAALRSAPPEAIELSLENARFASENDAADSIVWCTARDLSAAPRAHVRLPGLTNRSWPRHSGNDSIVPDHVLSTDEFDADPVAKADRRHFRVILEGTSKGIVLSRSRRSALGARLGRSPLLQNARETPLSRASVPEHAWSESDRLMARPDEAAKVDRIASADRCWRNWHLGQLTPNDGQFGADHPIVVKAIGRVQSPTSLQRLLRDPLGFIWRYGLGWRTPRDREQPLTIAPDEFGKLVHELLRRAVDALEPQPGYARASDEEIEFALREAARTVRESWPLEGHVPPLLLWSNTVDFGASLASVGLLRKDISDTGTRSWTEVPFGQPEDFAVERELPWDPRIPVAVPGTPITLRGTIDRLDLRSDHSAVRVTDYKTSAPPRNAGRIVIGGGSELQRALYGLACRQLLKEDPQIVARLLYLGGETLVLRLQDLDAAIEQIAEFINVAVAMLLRGATVPGRLAFDRSNDLRLALPASPGYERRKLIAYNKAGESLARFWSKP
ncbi:PD-(D/E)XK nuclease family protein [Bradyrhizobium huanghuaihaiense]|uniref:PD-(D/E)XK nuclease family protein n=1 Tax=Bradyrhizobium huanghuaihaiense TaxID=990078 RepID=UPI0021A9FADE|nr:PD-(D/E)XK nuclease family protein [Bradyrhizobium sp. CB3035]UWU76603.1 PD-(D/E)XK nuclease family protein [Bradyrhizobium sp. CB3035]